MIDLDLDLDARDEADVDLTRATSHELVLAPDHDGRLVADVVARWATTHAQPVTFPRRVPAGGAYALGPNRGPVRVDAVEFCRVPSGRGRSSGLVSRQVPVR